MALLGAFVVTCGGVVVSESQGKNGNQYLVDSAFQARDWANWNSCVSDKFNIRLHRLQAFGCVITSCKVAIN